MARDYSEVTGRLDLPRVAFTVNPEGKLLPLFFGRGFRGVVDASVEPFGSGDGSTFPAAIMMLRVCLDDRDPVPWEVLRRITSAEVAEDRWEKVAEGRSDLPVGDAIDRPVGLDKATAPIIEFHQRDWMPGFAAFIDDGKPFQPEGRAFCLLNLGAMLAAVELGDIASSEIPYFVAESMMHEIMHALEKWAGAEFSEERIVQLLDRYRAAAHSEVEPT